MKSKTIIGAIAGGVAFFLLGWVIYGMLLKDFMEANSNMSIARPMDQMVWWALILSNLIWAYFLALIFEWTNTSGFSGGMQKGLILGILTVLAFDLGMYSMTTMYNGMKTVLVDIAVNAVMCALVGGIIGMVMGSGGEKKAE